METMDLLRQPMLEILEAGCAKSVEFLAEELRMEFPREYQQVMQLFADKYDLSHCGVLQSPLTAINQVMQALQEEGLAARENRDGLILWRLRPAGD